MSAVKNDNPGKFCRLTARIAGLWAGLAIAAATMHGQAWSQSARPALSSALPMVAPAGVWLAAALDRLDVEHHWLPGHDHVAWRSGLPLTEEHGKKLTPLQNDETHCSAFAAAAAADLGVYLLHPPEHSHVLLANAQYDWLHGDEARRAGWRELGTGVEAQSAANRGELVVAVFKNRDVEQPGHIAVVRPAAKAPAAIKAKGPQITQAGFTNYRSTDLITGFSHHPGAWTPEGQGAVRFFVHAITAEGLAGE